MEVKIIGIGAAQANFVEYSSPQMLQRYTDLLIPLKFIFSKAPSQIEASDYDDLLTQLGLIKQLARQGVTDTNGTTEFQSYFTEDMVIRLNNVMRTLAVVDIPPSPGAPPLTDVEKKNALIAWQNLSDFQIDVLGALNSALALQSEAYHYTVTVQQAGTGAPISLNVSGSPTRTLQSMLQLEYIGLGNALMVGHMSALEKALSVSQQVLMLLTSVQNISNQLNITSRQPPFQMPSADNIEDFKKAYKEAASAYFSQLFPTPEPVASAATQLLQAKQSLWNQMLQLEQLNANANRNTGGSLANAIYLVVKDISAAFSGISTDNNPQLQTQLVDAVKKWILDAQDTPIADLGNRDSRTLAIQNHLTSAFTTAENLEESQRDDVRRYMFIFQQFYKSAASMIKLLGEMFDKITRGIDRQ